MKHLILDANNLLFRARHACFRRKYTNVIIHTFFRSLKPIVEKFSPDYVYFVLDGKPKKRLEMMPEYKGTRTYHDEDGFSAQRREIITIVKASLPFMTLRHPEAEADDVIAHLVLSSLPPSHEKIIVSSDTDFIQLCQSPTNTKLYNPITKGFREPPDYPYDIWKAMRGDSSDNIDGIRGLGNKRAATLASDKHAFNTYFSARPAEFQKFQKNVEMISLSSFTPTEEKQIQFSYGQNDLESLRDAFTELQFKSMISSRSWEKFSLPFRSLKDGTEYIDDGSVDDAPSAGSNF